MQSTPLNNNKRKIIEISPESQEATKHTMETNDLIQLIKDTINANLNEKLQTLPTKADIEEIKTQIGTVSTEVNTIKLENQQLKEELVKVKKENEDQKRNIRWLENQFKSNKLFIKGLNASKNPINEVESMFKVSLKMNINIISSRKIFERNGKMAVIVELESSKAIDEVFQNTRKLAGTKISIERDMIPTKQDHKKAFLILKKQLQEINKEHKVIVREDRLKINEKWFKWNNENKLISGNTDGKSELTKIYGEKITSINLEFDNIIYEANTKN